VSFSHETVSVTVTVRMVRQVPLVPVFEFGAGANAGNTDYTLSQTMVWLIGEGDVLRTVESIELAPIHLDQVATIDSVRREIPTPALTEIYDGAGYVDVGIQIQGVAEYTMTIPRDRILFIGVPENTTAEVAFDEITIVIRGPEGILEELDVSDISIRINLADYASMTGPIRIEGFEVIVGDWPPETVGAMDPGQGIIVNIQRA